MSHDTFEDLAAGYALGTLDGEDLALFQAHLAEGCARCSSALAQAEEALARLARQDPPVIPPPGVKQALLARIAASSRGVPRDVGAAPAERDPGRPPGRAWWFPWVAGAVAASLLAFFTGMFVAARYEARLGQMAREAAALAARIRQQEAALQRELDGRNRLVDLLRDPSTRVVALTGLGPGAGASGRVVWNEATGGQLYVSSLAPLPPDKTYELWTITGGTPRPAGLLAVDASGRGGHRVEPVRGERPVEVFAVTIEPAGGAPAPTGPIVLASK
jgi:anti-sigma-K factor RskA